MGWQTIAEGELHDAEGRCDIERLKQRVTVVTEEPQAWGEPRDDTDDTLSRYVKRNDDVRRTLRGFVCQATSEWDGSNNEARFRALTDEGGFYHGREADYARFIQRLASFQFWDQTDFAAGERFWFFHPLQFIRHFRKCGWLSPNEFAQIYSAKHYKNVEPDPDHLRSAYLTPLNLAVRKYGLTSPTRLAHFLGQGAVESYSLASMQETSMKGLLDATGMHGKEVNPASKIPESMLGHWYGQISTEDDAWYRNVKFNKNGKRITGSYDWKNGNCDHEDAQKFRGRGFKQLTGRSNYASYWVFRGWISRTSFNPSWWDDPAYIAHDRNGMKKIPAKIDDPQRISFPENCIDCAGFYLRFERPSTIEKIDSDKAETALTNKDKAIEHLISREVTHAINGGYIDADTRLDYTREAKKILT